nr:hypothetical protein [Tanacetum cinerariifolium]
MSTQQNIYTAGSENRPPMLNKKNYVPWSSRLLRYAKSRPNGKLIYNSIINGPYVRWMIPEPSDPNCEVPVNETFHVQTDDELTEKELKQIEADNQAIQTILLGSDIRIQEKKAKLFNEWERFTSTDGELIESYYHCFLKLINDLKQNKHFPEKIDTDYSQLYDFLKYNQKEVDDLKAERLARTQDPLALMATSNNPYTFLVLHQDQPSFNQNYMQQPRPNPEDITDPSTNPNGNGNLVVARAKGNATGHNGNQIRCYNCRGVGHFARNCIVRPKRMDAAYLQTQLLIAQKEEAGIQLQAKEFDLMAAATDLDEIKEVNENCILMANLQQASTSGTQTDKAHVYDSDGSAEYTELLEPILEPHQVPQNDNNVIYKVSSMEQSGGTVEQHPANVEETLLKEPAKFVRDFKSLAKEAGESLAKHKALELEIERLLRAVVSQDIVFVVQNNSIVETSNLQTELERMKERFENFIIKKENEYAKLWNDWYKKCEECKYDKISYDKAYNDMQQKIKRLQAQLGDLKGKKNSHLKTTYKNMFDSISVKRTQTKTIIDSLQNKLHDTIYENAKLRAQLFDKVYDQKGTTSGKSVNIKFAKQSILGKPPKVSEIYALSKPVTLISIPTPQGSKVVKNDKVIAPGMFKINPFKPSREEKHVPNKVRASARTNPITVSQPPPRSNTKNDRVSSASKSSRSKNKEVDVEEHHRKLLLSRNKKHMSSECNNIKLATQNVISKVICAMCKKCLNSVNHDVCLLNYVNGMKSRDKKQKANVSINEHQKKQKPKVKKTKKVGSSETLASPKPSKTRSVLRWSPTGRMFDLKDKIIVSSKSDSHSNCSKGDNACTSNPLEPTIKRFPNSTFSLFLGTVRFRNDHVAAILGFGDLQWGNILITRVYFVEELGHNLFSVGQFYDSNLEVAFRRNACFIRNLEGVDLLKGNRSTNLYTINLHEMASVSPMCLMARASSTNSWLWHQRLSHLNFDTINDLAKNDLVSG